MFINVLGNAIATIVVSKWEKDFDHERAVKVLHDAKHNPHLLTSEAELDIEDIGSHQSTLPAPGDTEKARAH